MLASGRNIIFSEDLSRPEEPHELGAPGGALESYELWTDQHELHLFLKIRATKQLQIYLHRVEHVVHFASGSGIGCDTWDQLSETKNTMSQRFFIIPLSASQKAPQVRSFAERALGEIRSLQQGVSLTSDKVAFMEFMYKVTERILLGEDDPPTAASVRLKDLEQVGKQCLQDLLSHSDANKQFSPQWGPRLGGNQDCAATSSNLPEREGAKEANLVPLTTTQTYSPGRLEGMADDVQLKRSLPRGGSTTAHLSVDKSPRAIIDGFEASSLLRVSGRNDEIAQMVRESNNSCLLR